MFADYTNVFYSHKDVKTLFHFSTLNNWFKAKDEIPLKIPELVISDKLIERKRFIKHLDVILDDCISRKDYIRTVENKVRKIYKIIILSQTITRYKFS